MIYIPGLTIQNPPFDTIKNSIDEVLATQLAYFRRSLSRGGLLCFSFATDSQIDADGTEIKAFYDHPLLHRYQKTIFRRVSDELKPEGEYYPDGFSIVHKWWPHRCVLTRYAVTDHPMQFKIDYQHFNFEVGHRLYISNNTRYSADRIIQAALRDDVGFTKCHILGDNSSGMFSNIRLAVCINQ